MSNKPSNKIYPDAPTIYQIKIEGHLDKGWTDWFRSVTIMLDDDGNTLLSCHIIDQAELYSVLRMVRDLGASLISVNRVEADNT